MIILFINILGINNYNELTDETFNSLSSMGLSFKVSLGLGLQSGFLFFLYKLKMPLYSNLRMSYLRFHYCLLPRGLEGGGRGDRDGEDM